jgi:predicted O-linked N-acetylglucosamine transferase (SPINDLY family)
MTEEKNISGFLCRVKSAFDDGRLDTATDILSHAAKYVSETSNLFPSEVVLWEKFGVHLLLMGEIEQLVDSLAKMAKMHPWNSDVHSHMLFNLHHLPGIDQQMIFDEHKRWAQIHAPVDRMEVFHNNNADPDRRLRIGYISPDFRMHPVAFFIGPLVYGHNRENVEVYGYGNAAKPEATTEYLKGKFDFYRNIYGLDTQSLINLIKEDKIDILVELAGHTNGNSLIALAYKPAPVQVSYLGYPGTTGMQQIDYRLVDECVNPPQSQKFYTEELIYLPQPFTCYSTTDLKSPVTALPAEKNGYITFGAFQNNCKINSDVLSLGAKILKANNNSRLLLRFAKGSSQNIRDYYLRQFELLGISPDRIEIGGWLTYIEHLRQYERVDIGLDTFPFNGHTTICDALWMGVPTISLSGESFACRLGLSMLKSVGLEFFAAKTAEEYAAKAISLAQNHPSLAKIRASVRQRMLSSTLCNSKKFASGVEDAYRKMWHRWCKNRGDEMSSKKTRMTRSRQRQERPCESAEPVIAARQTQAKRGIIYMIWGNDEKHEKTLQRAIASVRKYHPELPVHIERFETGGKINKTRICDLSPFEETAFLDNDTIVMGKLDFGFDKARQFGLACVINECPWARRYRDSRLSGDMVEYNSGVLFYTKKAKPVFDAWAKLFPTTDASIIHIQNGQMCLMPVADQGSFALAIEQTGFQPFVLPYNWNFRPQFYRSCYGPIKIWHAYYDVPEVLMNWNKEQSTEDAILRFFLVDMTAKDVSEGNLVGSNSNR